MRKVSVLVLFMLFSAPVFAQSTNQTQKVVDALIAQRNAAMNTLAGAEANLAILREELTAAQEKIKELEKQLPEKPKE